MINHLCHMGGRYLVTMIPGHMEMHWGVLMCATYMAMFWPCMWVTCVWRAGWFTGRMCYMSTPVGKKTKRKEKSALKLIKTDQQVKHCIRIKNLLLVNTNTNHVPKSGYNQIDVARIVFIFVCVRVCVLFCYWLSHVIAIAHRWIIG